MDKKNIMKETKYLRVVMDDHPTFKNHIDTVKLNGLMHCHYISPILLRTIQTMPFLNHTCNMKVSYGGRHKHKS